MTLRTGERDLHSGIYGGAALNAAHALMTTLDALLVSHDGLLDESLRKGIVPPTEEELRGWRELPPGSDELADQGARPKDARAADDFYLRTFAEPALDVNGIAVGSPYLQKTVLPVEAVANVSIRLAPGQKVGRRSPPRSSACCARPLRRARSSRSRSGERRRRGSCSPDAKVVQLGLDAFERVAGPAAGADPVRRHPPDRARALGEGHPDRHHRASGCPIRRSIRPTSGWSPSTCLSGSQPLVSCFWPSPRCSI